MTVTEIMTYLQAHGDQKLKLILIKHGVKEPFFGVKIEYLKPLQKQIKKDYQLAKDLYATGNADAQYLAGLIADDEAMTADDLQLWLKGALSKNIVEYTLPWVAAGSRQGYLLALQWIDKDDENTEAAGWNTLSNYIALTPNYAIDIALMHQLLQRVVQNIHTAKNRVRYTMNGFIIALGCYVPELTAKALTAAAQTGRLVVDMNGTACKVPDAAVYIQKVAARGATGKKKKTVKC